MIDNTYIAVLEISSMYNYNSVQITIRANRHPTKKGPLIKMKKGKFEKRFTKIKKLGLGKLNVNYLLNFKLDVNI